MPNDVANFIHAKSVNPPLVRSSVEIRVGDVFRIRGNVYRGKTFVCEKVTPEDSYTHLATCGDGTDYWFNQQQFNYYGVVLVKD